MTDSDEHTGLLRYEINYGCKKFRKTGDNRQIILSLNCISTKYDLITKLFLYTCKHILDSILVPISQTVWSLMRTQWLAKLARKMIFLYTCKCCFMSVISLNRILTKYDLITKTIFVYFQTYFGQYSSSI